MESHVVSGHNGQFYLTLAKPFWEESSLFSAVVHQLTNLDPDHPVHAEAVNVMRESTADYLERYCFKYEEYILAENRRNDHHQTGEHQKDEMIKQLIAELRTGKRGGGWDALAVLSDILGIKFIIVSPQQEDILIFESNAGLSTQEVYLYYSGADVYHSIIGVSDGTDEQRCCKGSVENDDMTSTSMIVSDKPLSPHAEAKQQINSLTITPKSDLANPSGLIHYWVRTNNNDHLELLRIAPDGNCIFGAMVHQLEGFDIRYAEHKLAVADLRRKCVDFLELHWREYENLIISEAVSHQEQWPMEEFKVQFIKNRIKALRKDRIWGGSEILAAAADMLKKRIQVFTRDAPPMIFGEVAGYTGRMLAIFYNGINHYDSVVSSSTSRDSLRATVNEDEAPKLQNECRTLTIPSSSVRQFYSDANAGENSGFTTKIDTSLVQQVPVRLSAVPDPERIAPGFPDSRTCLLHQKLQMLNICMERRRIREGGLPFTMTGTSGVVAAGGAREGSHESEDEFFDCSDEDDEDSKKRHSTQPVGRLSRLGKMLLVDSDEPLYIPITQEPVPKTEDQLEDDAEVMLKLGPGSELCTQMMSASLLSDMESFKAANPAGKLEDFIRWYSPRDWIEEDADERDPFGRKGHLSSRMMIPGNTWQTVWENARPVPARRQKRLFDDAKEAEKVLHYFESRSIGQIAQLTTASLFHTAIKTISTEAASDGRVIPNFSESMEKITSTCCKLSRENWTTKAPTPRGNSLRKYEALLADITQLETVIIQVRSLRKKLFNEDGDGDDQNESNDEVLTKLLKAFESELADGAKSSMAKRVLEMFTEAKKAANEQSGEQSVTLSLPDPAEKQFTLRLSGKTVNKGAGSPQFMRAILTYNEFRLCGAFSKNTTFY